MNTETPTHHPPSTLRGAARLNIGITLVFLILFLAVPVACVFTVAFSKGYPAFLVAISHPETLAAIKLTFIAVGLAVPLNTIFGLSAAWALTKFDFRGRSLLLALIDLPFAVSPVVAGLVFVFLFGARSSLGGWLIDHGIRIVYAPTGIVLGTLFVTFPFIARELVPVMRAIGREDETAAYSLGAGGFQTFWRVTLPNIRWGLMYGIIVCTARALGEFGAVSVLSGHIRGETNTIPLHVEILYNEYNQVGAFAVASLLTVIGFIALIAKKIIEMRMGEMPKVL